MEKEEYRKHFELEERFWWFVGRREIIEIIFKCYNVIKDRESNLLDIGCGTGLNLKIFQEFINSFGCDLSDEAIYFCKKRNLKKIVKSNAEKLPFKNEIFHIVTLLDVLYHKNIQSDINVLRETKRVLKKDGYLIITDSAFNFLTSKHDRALHTRERYTKEKLRSKLKESGFFILKLSYFNSFIFPVILSVRFFERLTLNKNIKPESNLKAINNMFNKILIYILRMEAFFIRSLNFPFGSSLLCLVKKLNNKGKQKI